MCPVCYRKKFAKFLIIAISMISFGIMFREASASENHNHHKNMKMKDKKQGKRLALNKSSKDSLIAVLEANEKLHAAFFEYNGKTVEKNAHDLKVAIENIKDKEISKLLVFSKEKLNEIKANVDRKKNNQNYHLVSMALIYIVNKFDVGEKYNAYSCPMVKKKWLQNSQKMSKVHNPYAPEMPHCGTQDSHY